MKKKEERMPARGREVMKLATGELAARRAPIELYAKNFIQDETKIERALFKRTKKHHRPVPSQAHQLVAFCLCLLRVSFRSNEDKN